MDWRCKIPQLEVPSYTVDWFWNPIKGSGLIDLVRTSYGLIDNDLLSAFAERWHMRPIPSIFMLVR